MNRTLEAIMNATCLCVIVGCSMGVIIIDRSHWIWLFLLSFGAVINLTLLFPFLKKVFWDRERNTEIQTHCGVCATNLSYNNMDVLYCSECLRDSQEVYRRGEIIPLVVPQVPQGESDMPRKGNWRGNELGGGDTTGG